MLRPSRQVDVGAESIIVPMWPAWSYHPNGSIPYAKVVKLVQVSQQRSHQWNSFCLCLEWSLRQAVQTMQPHSATEGQRKSVWESRGDSSRPVQPRHGGVRVAEQGEGL